MSIKKCLIWRRASEDTVENCFFGDIDTSFKKATELLVPAPWIRS